MDTPLFGPAGSSASFEAEGHSSTMEAPAWLAARGLTAFEYQCGHGVRVKLETAAKFGAEAKAHGIARLSARALLYFARRRRIRPNGTTPCGISSTVRGW